MPFTSSVAAPFRGVRHSAVSFRAAGSPASATVNGQARNLAATTGRAALLRSNVRILLAADDTAGRAGSSRIVVRCSPGDDTTAGAGADRPGPGDWACPECGFSNFASRESCRECSCARPSSPSPMPSPARRTAPSRAQGRTGEPRDGERAPLEERAGDWKCPDCGFKNFASNDCCDECDKPRPTGSGKVRKGRDWTCPECGFLNFGSRSSCHDCLAERPKVTGTPQRLNRQQAQAAGGNSPSGGIRGQQSGSASPGATATTPHGKGKRGRASKPGEWQCSACGFTNFPQRETCFKCNNPK